VNKKTTAKHVAIASQVHKISVVYSGGRLVKYKAWLVYVQGLGFKYDV